MTPEIVDRICLLIALVLPIPLILRYDRIGVALGTFVVWSSLYVSGVLLAALDPKRDAAILDSLWLLFGWIGGLLYCVPIYLVKRLVSFCWRRFTSDSRKLASDPGFLALIERSRRSLREEGGIGLDELHRELGQNADSEDKP